ncbi:hypothetical protein ACF082_22370 [Streptomyces lydicus]|uniref:hypothetical protein n=1 Tax=Streptomyces lydicus TaxID=47763 RepID=UPI0036F06F55
MTDQFDAQLDRALDNVRDMLPESALLRLEAKLRQIHAERPDLEGSGRPAVANHACASQALVV